MIGHDWRMNILNDGEERSSWEQMRFIGRRTLDRAQSLIGLGIIIVKGERLGLVLGSVGVGGLRNQMHRMDHGS